MRLASAARVTDDGLDDDALMRRVAVADASAFRTLVEVHGAMLHRIAYRMLLDAAEAEDVAQESLLRLWRDASKWQAGHSGVAAWLTRVAMNQCLDRLRRRKFASDDAVPEREDESPLAPDTIDAEASRARVASAISDLPERQRAAIVLTYYEDMSNNAAASLLDMNIKAFESLLLRARSALGKALGPERVS
jgi:RNA polymerase sigma factor (sigma-70 family)